MCPVEKFNLTKYSINIHNIIEHKFYKCRDGSYFPYDRNDIKNVIDVFNPDTFMPFLQALDIPYYDKEWTASVEKDLQRTQSTFHTIGKYIAKMSLCSFKAYKFKDSDSSFNELNKLKNYIDNLSKI